MEMTSTQKRRLQEILDAADIEGLLAVGAPADEYRAEAERIVAAIERWPGGSPSEPELLRVLQTVWAHSFGPLSEEEMRKRSPGLRNVAQRILESLAAGQRAKSR